MGGENLWATGGIEKTWRDGRNPPAWRSGANPSERISCADCGTGRGGRETEVPGLVSVSPPLVVCCHGAGGGRKPAGGPPLSQHGGGAKLLEFEHEFFRHPHPDSGSMVERAMRAKIKRLVGIGVLHRFGVRRAFQPGGPASRTVGTTGPVYNQL